MGDIVSICPQGLLEGRGLLHGSDKDISSTVLTAQASPAVA